MFIYICSIATPEATENRRSYKKFMKSFTNLQILHQYVLADILLRNFKKDDRDEFSGARFYSMFDKSAFLKFLPVRRLCWFRWNSSIVQCVINPTVLMIAKRITFGHGRHINIEDLNQCNYWKKFANDTSILQDLGHEFIIQHLDSYACSMYGIVFMEFCYYGPLERHIGQLTTNMIRLWFIQIAKAVRYINFNNIVHRNISLDTIYIRGNLSIALADFEQAERIDNDLNMVRVCGKGTWGFIAPEMLYVGQDTFVDGIKADAFAVGVVLLCMAIEMADPMEALDHHFFFGEIPFAREDPALELTMTSLLLLEPVDRPGISQVLQLPDCLRPDDELLDSELDEGFVEN